MSHKDPQLPARRLDEPRAAHKVTMSKKQKRCIYCSYLRMKQKIDEPDAAPFKTRSTTKTCGYCDEHVCGPHFDEYHSRQ